jgi:hypothetical protein
VAQIFKAKYFPNNSILEAKVGKRPVFFFFFESRKRPLLAWKSILAAKDIIQSGTIWRVGNGKDIKVWMDNWLPKPVSFKVQTHRGQFAEDTRVAEFIDQGSQGWNGILIYITFTKEETTLIKNIPLSPFQPMDCLLWRCTTNGVFSVRSAYHLEVERQEILKGGVSNKTDRHEVWKAC